MEPEQGTPGAEVVAAARAALAALGSERVVAQALLARPARPAALLAVGKAAAAMAAGAARVVGFVPGLVVCKDAPAAVPSGCTVRLGGHPWPDAGSERATRAALEHVARASRGAELLALVSGGTSALLGGPIDGVSLDEMVAATDRLLRAGEPIDAINAVRRRLGAALGGRLAAATEARVRLLVVSDVAGDDLRVIGSGPFVPPPIDDSERAVEVARRAGLATSLVDRVASATPAPADLARALAGRIDAEIVARPADLAAAAARALAARGLRVQVDPAPVGGRVEALAARLQKLARDLAPGEAAVVVGEPTVVVRGAGQGGRAQHCAALVALALDGLPDRACLAIGSDGTDGATDAAGALVTGQTAALARAAGIDLQAAADAFDSHPALDALGALLRTGPTGTNLTDLYVVARAMLPAT